VRILSPFHDYYDGVQQHGADPNTIYLRKTEETDFRDFPAPISCWEVRNIGGVDLNTDVQPILIGFCGKFYFLFRVCPPSGEISHHITITGAHNRLISLGKTKRQQELIAEGLEKFKQQKPGKFYWWWRAFISEKHIAEWLKRTPGSDNPFIKLNAPVFKAEKTGWRRGRRFTVEVNPMLKDIGFPGVVDAWTAYQTIHSYITGPLAIKMDPPQIIDDVTLAESKGFNKESFRTDSPGKKRKRRGK